MIFKLNNKRYNLSVLWQTTTLQQGIEIIQLKLSEHKLVKLLENDGSEIFDEEVYNYIRKVIEILSDCPYEDLQYVADAQIGALWDVISYIVKSLYLVKFDNYKAIGITEIRWRGKIYKMPKSLMIDEQEILAHQEPAVNIVEVSNLAMYLSQMKSEGLSAMKYICAILLKENDDEVYDEKLIAEKAELFKDLPLSIVFECFFFINSFSNSYLISSLNYLPNQKKKTVKKIKYSIRGYIKSLRLAWSAILKMSRK